jgi:DNA-binding NarL/FixJ family response regulator
MKKERELPLQQSQAYGEHASAVRLQRAPSGIRSTLYLVDDHPAVLAGLRTILAQPDFQVIGEATTGKEAIKGIIRLQPDVVLLDVRLPDKDGLHLLRELKPQVPRISFILFTGFPEPSHLCAAIASGASAVAFKDDQGLDLPDLVRRVASGEDCLPRSIWIPLLQNLEKRKRTQWEEHPEQWTEYQVQILHFLAQGMSNQDIATLLGVSFEATRFRIKKIFGKLGVSDRAHAVAQAIAKGILQIADLSD